MIWAVANVRDIPYFTSAQVTGLRSCHVSPSRKVKLHVLPPSATVPVFVARSGARAGNVSCRVGGAHAVRVRWNTRPSNAISAPTLSRCGSHVPTGPWPRTYRVPPAAAGTEVVASTKAAVLGEQDAETKTRPKPMTTAALHLLARMMAVTPLVVGR